VQVWIITGGIACGKSSVVARLAELINDSSVFSADAVVHDELTNPQTIETITQVFGLEILAKDGLIDRSVLRSIVLHDRKAKTHLEEILHPIVRRRYEEMVLEARSVASATRVFLAEIPLYHESDSVYPCDLTIAVCASRQIQLARIMAHRKISKTEADTFIQSQLPVINKLERSDVGVWNDGSMSALEGQLELLVSLS